MRGRKGVGGQEGGKEKGEAWDGEGWKRERE